MCGDGSGTFDMKMHVRLNLLTSYTEAEWKISEGTGDYADLWAGGKLVGTPVVPGFSIFDVYNGIAASR